jgi:raffinose/stachyose/melibiose transport system permease protein
VNDSTVTTLRNRPIAGAGKPKAVGRSKPAWSPRRWLAVWWFALPAVVFYVFVMIVPAARGVFEAFTNWDGLSSTQTFVGFSNFVTILHDPVALGAIIHTLIIAISVTVFQNLIGLLLALGVKSNIKTGKILSVIFFAPAVITPVITAFLWQYIYSPAGVINYTLNAVGLGALQQSWLGDSKIALVSVIVVIVWQFSGYSMVIFIAGLGAIPDEVTEAAAIDGAGPVRSFFDIRLPLLKPALLVNFLLTLIAGLKQFDVVWVLTQGGPGVSTQTLSTLIFQNAFLFGKFGYGVALAVLLAIIAIPISVIQYRAVARGGDR